MRTAVILSCIVLGISAYKFDDALYNQFLVKDFQSLDDDISVLHPRARRDEEAAKCHKPHFHLCCGGEQMEAIHKEFQDIKKQCYKEVTGHEFFHGKPFDPFSCEDIEKRKKELLCVKQCEGQKKGLTDEKGNIKEDEMKKFVAETNQMEWLKPKLDEIVTKCLAEAKEATEKSDKNACNPAQLKFSHCMFREVQLACPDDKIDNPKTCQIVRDFAKHSSFFIPHIPHP